MPTLYVYLYQDGAITSFADLSGQELSSIARASGMELDTDDDEEYAKVSVSDDEFSELAGKRTEIKPRQYGLRAWKGRVQLEFLASPIGDMVDRAKAAQGGKRGTRKRKTKTRGKKLRKTTRRR